jgi:hypothetical protein
MCRGIGPAAAQIHTAALIVTNAGFTGASDVDGTISKAPPTFKIRLAAVNGALAPWRTSIHGRTMN